MTSTHRAENICEKYLLYHVHEIARKYPRELVLVLMVTRESCLQAVKEIIDPVCC
jgi:hypothetical protein